MIVLKGKPRPPCEAALSYLVEFSANFDAVIAAVEGVVDEHDYNFIPRSWMLDTAQKLGVNSFVRFASDESFDEGQVNRVRKWIDDLDQACYLMVKEDKT